MGVVDTRKIEKMCEFLQELIGEDYEKEIVKVKIETQETIDKNQGLPSLGIVSLKIFFICILKFLLTTGKTRVVTDFSMKYITTTYEDYKKKSVFTYYSFLEEKKNLFKEIEEKAKELQESIKEHTVALPTKLFAVIDIKDFIKIINRKTNYKISLFKISGKNYGEKEIFFIDSISIDESIFHEIEELRNLDMEGKRRFEDELSAVNHIINIINKHKDGLQKNESNFNEES